MSWLRRVVIVLMLLEGAWMLFDGTHALTVGDYVTSSSGQYAGQLGPWSRVVQALGIEPRSTLMKSIYEGYGFIAITMAVCFALRLFWTRWGMVPTAILGLWYLPVGTVINSIVLILLFVLSEASRTPS